MKNKNIKKGTTETFIEERLDGNSSETIETGSWYSGFEKVKTYATENKIPFVSVWSNGDICSLCKKLEKNFMTDVFRNWMKTSGCIFWFGYSGDKAKEDKTNGKVWSKDSKLKTYPFMRFYWSDGNTTVNRTESGEEWNDGKTLENGAVNIINHLNELISEVNSVKKSRLGMSNSMKIRTNPEWTKEEIEEFRQAIKDNDGYCPCEDEHIPDTKCMCRKFREQKTEGNCHCGLYNKYFA